MGEERSWVAVVIIVIICLIALIVGSCFGIFFSGEDTGTGQDMPSVIREINEDYETQLETIQNNLTHDTLEMSGSRAVWPGVKIMPEISLFYGIIVTM